MESEDVAPEVPENTNESASSSQEKLKSALDQFDQNQKRALSVMTVIALAFGAYFLREYLQLIAIAGVLVYLFGSNKPDLVVGTIVFVVVLRGSLRILKLGKRADG